MSREEYEDELDRMKAQRRRRKTTNSRQYPNRGQQNARPSKTSYRGKTSKRKRRKRKKTGFVLIFFIFLIAGGIVYGKQWMKERDGYWNIAIFGVDSRDSNLEKGTLADVQMIASINKKTGEIRLVSIFRDTYLQISDDGEFHKINEAYLKGGYQQAIATLKRNLDIEVDDYATFSWKAVADAINILGGIDLEITDSEFAYINSFITETVESTGIYSTHLKSAGMNHLDGVQAVAYSRLRLMDTDFNRTERQRKVVSLALEKAKLADFNTLKVVAATVIPEISTSIGLTDIFPLARNVNRYHLGQSAGFPFAKTTGRIDKRDCVIPMTLESNVVLLHQFLFDLEEYQPSSSVKVISAKISEKTGIYEEGKAAAPDQGWAEEESSFAETTSNEERTQKETKTSPEPSEEENTTIEEENTTIEEVQQEEPTSTTEAVAEPLEPKETTYSKEQIWEGPGAVTIPSSESHTEPTEAYGPGFN